MREKSFFEKRKTFCERITCFLFVIFVYIMIGKDWVFGREKMFFERETLDRLRKDLRRVLFSLLFFFMLQFKASVVLH